MTHNSYRESYLNLLADCLCFELWDEPLKPLSATAQSGLSVSILKVIDRFLRKYRLAFGIVHTMPKPTYWPTLADTMVGRKRLRNIRLLCEEVETNGIPGAWVECGV